MLTRDKLVELYRELVDEPVLSVYLDSDQHDPAQRTKWRRRLDGLVSQCRREIENGKSRGDVEAFNEAWSRLGERLRDYDAFLPGKGWVGFSTEDQVWYAEEVPVPMPDLVRWEPGIRVAPYVRGLKQERSVVVVLADSQRARVFEYQDGTVDEVSDLRADTFLGDLSDVGQRKRSAHRTGLRGETATDQAQRILEVSTDRMLKELVQVLGERASDHGFLVLGGTPETVKRMADAVPKGLATRTVEKPSLHLEMTSAEVRDAVEAAASELTERLQSTLLEEVVDQARAHGRGCLGREETEQALREMRVDTLLVSRRFVAEHPDLADHCVGAAFAQGADVEELGEAVGARLDTEGEGMAARLRFRIRNDEENGGPAA